MTSAFTVKFDALTQTHKRAPYAKFERTTKIHTRAINTKQKGRKKIHARVCILVVTTDT